MTLCELTDRFQYNEGQTQNAYQICRSSRIEDCTENETHAHECTQSLKIGNEEIGEVDSFCFFEAKSEVMVAETQMFKVVYVEHQRSVEMLTKLWNSTSNHS